MDRDRTALSRRQLLATTGGVSLVGLAGCLQATPPGEPSEDLRDAPLPEGAEECVSVDGEQRDPEAVSAKEDVAYQFHPDYTGASGYIEMCANCRFFCSGGTLGSNIGACTVVEGGIRSQDWCALWQPVEALEARDRPARRGPQS